MLTNNSRAEIALPWVARAAWVGVGAFGSSAIDSVVVGVVAAALWVVGLAGLSLASTPTLTIARLATATAVPAAAVLAIDRATTSAVAVFGCSLVTAGATFVAEFGRAYAQSSAYGAEQRFPLRPPLAYLVASTVTWAMVTATAIVAVSLGATGRWLPAAALAAGAVGGTAWAWRRWHRLSQRWLVYVPAGVVVHDQLVLAETLMLRRHEIANIALARAGTDAADLTGPATGHALEITTTESITAILAPSTTDRVGRVIHLSGALVSPSRPGAALAAYVASRRASPPPSTR